MIVIASFSESFVIVIVEPTSHVPFVSSVALILQTYPAAIQSIL